MRRFALLLTVSLLAAASSAALGRHHVRTFADEGRRAVATLLHVYYSGNGGWRACDVAGCPSSNSDWGDDSLTYALAMRVSLGKDRRLRPVFRALAERAAVYPPPCTRPAGCTTGSDPPALGSIALAHE